MRNSERRNCGAPWFFGKPYIPTDILNNLPLDIRATITFQKHTAGFVRSTLPVPRYIDSVLSNAWIGRYPTNPWPLRSPDLTLLDFLISEDLKKNVYKKQPFRKMEQFEETIVMYLFYPLDCSIITE